MSKITSIVIARGRRKEPVSGWWRTPTAIVQARARLIHSPAERPRRVMPLQAPILFVSSTSEDLKPHREAAGHAAVAADIRLRLMEYFVGSGIGRRWSPASAR